MLVQQTEEGIAKLGNLLHSTYRTITRSTVKEFLQAALDPRASSRQIFHCPL
jgi:hypothetical protein